MPMKRQRNFLLVSSAYTVLFMPRRRLNKRKTAVAFAVWGNKKRILAVKPQNIVRQKNAPQIGLPNRSNKKGRTHKMCPVFCAKIKYFCKLRNKRFCPAAFRPGEWHRTRNFRRNRGSLQDIPLQEPLAFCL